MENKLEHIGIAVEDLSSALGELEKIFQLSNVSVLDYQKDEVHYKMAFVHFGKLFLELVEPLNRRGLAQKHLDQFGPGVYHFAFEVTDLESTMDRLHSAGIKLQHIRTGIAGGRVVFLENPFLPGIYLEFVESNKGEDMQNESGKIVR